MSKKARRPRVPKVLFLVVSDYANPHSQAPLSVFTQRQKAERERRWGDQRIVEYVLKPKTSEV